MYKLLLSILPILLCRNSAAQFEEFSISVTEYESGNLGNAVDKCPGTMFTDRHVLTTAACAIPTNSSLQIAISIFYIYPMGYGTCKRVDLMFL